MRCLYALCLTIGCSYESFSSAPLPPDGASDAGPAPRPVVTAPPPARDAGQPPDDGLATVVVEDDLGPVADAVVIASDADGRLVAQAQTDGEGVVTLPPAASVSVLQPKRITTVFGAPERIRVPAARAASNRVMELTVTATTTLPGVSLELDVPCGAPDSATGGSRTFAAFTGCGDEPTFDVYGFARSADGARIVGFGALTELAFRPGLAANHEIDVSSTELAEHSLHVRSVPAGAVRASVSVVPRRSGRALGPVLRSDVDAPMPETIATVAVPRLDFVGYELGGSLTLRENGPRLEAGFESRLDVLPAASEWAPTAELALFTPDCAVNLSDPAHPGASWRLTDEGSLGHVITVEAIWDGTTTWHASAPAERAGSIRLPELPDGLMELLPSDLATLEVSIRHLSSDGLRTHWAGVEL